MVTAARRSRRRTAAFRFQKERDLSQCYKVAWVNCRTRACTDPFDISPTDQLIEVWPSDWSLFVQSATITVDNALLDEARTTMTAFLQGRQRALYALLANGIQNANTDLSSSPAGLRRSYRPAGSSRYETLKRVRRSESNGGDRCAPSPSAAAPSARRRCAWRRSPQRKSRKRT